MIESENFHEDAKIEAKPTNLKSKMVLLPLIIQLNKFSNYKVQSRALLNCYRVIDKTKPSQNQNPANPQGGRGGRGGFRGRGGRGWRRFNPVLLVQGLPTQGTSQPQSG